MCIKTTLEHSAFKEMQYSHFGLAHFFSGMVNEIDATGSVTTFSDEVRELGKEKVYIFTGIYDKNEVTCYIANTMAVRNLAFCSKNQHTEKFMLSQFLTLNAKYTYPKEFKALVKDEAIILKGVKNLEDCFRQVDDSILVNPIQPDEVL